MFSTSDIVHNSNAKSFERGRQLAEREGSVVERRYAAGRQSCDVSADVRSSSGIAEHFHTYLATDPEGSSIVDYECTCPAARKHDSMCKHAVALAVSFMREPSSFQGFDDQFKVSTSRSIKRYLDHAPGRKAFALADGEAHLHATVSCEFGSWSLKATIEALGAKYVVSDLGGFGEAVAMRSFYEHGKRLAFVHAPESFDDTSRGIALLIAEKAQSDGAPRRELTLGEAEVVRLLDSLGDAAFSFEGDGGARCNMTVRDADPQVMLRIVPAQDGAYQLVRDERVVCAVGSGHAYVFLDGDAYRCSSAFTPAATFLRDVYASADDELVVAPEDLPGFCSNVLPMLEERMSVAAPAALDALRPRDARFAFYFDRTGSGRNEAIELTVGVDYGHGERTLLAPASSESAGIRAAGKAPADVPGDGQEYRDEGAEGEAVEMAYSYFPAAMRLPLDDEEAAGDLLYHGIARFQAAGDVYTTPDFDRLITDRRVRVQVGLSLAGGLIDLDVHATDMAADELAALLAAYQKRKRFHRLKDGALASLADMDLEHLERMARDLGIRPQDLASGSVELPTYAAFFLDREYAEAVRDESFDAYISRFENESLYDWAPPAVLKDRLRPYQVDGFRWMRKLASIGFGGILADEMGLGKTLQMIAYLTSVREEQDAARPALVVCPASLVYNWVEEFAKFAPALAVCAIDGDRTQRRKRRETEGVDVFVASYDAVRMDSEAFQQAEYSTCVLDEAQFIKNHATKTTRAVKRLKAEGRFALTGTPIENRLSEIWSIFDFLMPGFLGSYAQFRRRFEADIIGGDEDVARRFQALIAPFVLRRLKQDVLKELPEKQENVVMVALGDEQRKLYDAHEQRLREDLLAQRREARANRRTEAGRVASAGVKVDVLAELMRLRQVALEPSLLYDSYALGSSKTEAIVELVAEARDAGKKTLVFSQFTSYLDLLKKRFDAEGVAYYEITGATPKRERMHLVNEFNGNDVPLFLVSLKAGGTGLNLIGASVVVHADPWWNSAATEQATDRAHRIGQEHMVSVYKVIAKGTIEERILRLQEAKSHLAGSVIGKTSLSSLSSLTRDELEGLLFDD